MIELKLWAWLQETLGVSKGRRTSLCKTGESKNNASFWARCKSPPCSTFWLHTDGKISLCQSLVSRALFSASFLPRRLNLDSEHTAWWPILFDLIHTSPQILSPLSRRWFDSSQMIFMCFAIIFNIHLTFICWAVCHKSWQQHLGIRSLPPQDRGNGLRPVNQCWGIMETQATQA